MDDIIDKDIFLDQDLKKLSPDYKPVNVLLRMQLRRTLVRDTHVHSHNATRHTSWSRKSIKKTKDGYNINKEILKLRNDFNNINLKNRMTLKCLDPLKTKYDAANELETDCVGNSGEDIMFLPEFDDDQTELAVRNDLDFKLNAKEKYTKTPRQINRKKVRNKDVNSVNIIEHSIDKDVFENNGDLFKIECIYTNRNLKNGSNLPNINDITEIESSNTNEGKRVTTLNNVDTQPNDLQQLLIMMTLSSKPSNSDEVKEDETSDNHTFMNESVTQAQNSCGLLSPDCQEIETILSVAPIRVEINDKEKVIARKYVDKWKQYVRNRKMYLVAQRQATLNNFFDKIIKKKMDMSEQESDNKAKNYVRDYNNYQHRYRVQKHIIALQKAKLEEQNRLIEELKYNKIIEASRQSVDMMREEVRRSYYDIDRQLKPKIKCLTNELKIHDIEEPSLVLHCLKVPQFLQRMEKRAREREEKHALIRERRKQMEEERVRLKQQAELARAEMDKEEKMKRIKELKEKRKREKIEGIRRKQFVERLRALIVMADLHYEKTLMAKYGIRPLRLLMEIRQDNIEKARAHYKFQLKNHVFLNWMWYTEDMWIERNFKAEELYRKKLLRKVIEGFKKNHHEYILKRQVAEDYNDFYATKLAFKKICEGFAVLKKEHEVRWQTAVVYHNSNLLFKAFTCWRTLPVLNALKRVQEVRKARWREKVLQVVPDYTPPED